MRKENSGWGKFHYYNRSVTVHSLRGNHGILKTTFSVSEESMKVPK